MENTAIAVQVVEADAPKWGAENPLRGSKYNELALAFSRAFPVGSTLTPGEFDSWAAESGSYYHSVPTPEERKGADGNSSDRWLAHLQRRHQLRVNINKAGAHTRIAAHGGKPFVIEQIGHHALEVRSPEVALAKSNLTARLTSLCGHKRRNLAYLMQSADWAALPAHERAIAESLYDDIDKFETDIGNNAEWLTKKFAKLEHKIKKALADGTITARNGGFKRMLSDESIDDAEQ